MTVGIRGTPERRSCGFSPVPNTHRTVRQNAGQSGSAAFSSPKRTACSTGTTASSTPSTSAPFSAPLSPTRRTPVSRPSEHCEHWWSFDTPSKGSSAGGWSDGGSLGGSVDVASAAGVATDCVREHKLCDRSQQSKWPPAKQCLEAFAMIGPLIQSLAQVFGQSISAGALGMMRLPPQLAVSANKPPPEVIRNIKDICTEMKCLLDALLTQIEDIEDDRLAAPSTISGLSASKDQRCGRHGDGQVSSVTKLGRSPSCRSITRADGRRITSTITREGSTDLVGSAIPPASESQTTSRQRIGSPRCGISRQKPSPSKPSRFTPLPAQPKMCEPVLLESDVLYAQALQLELEAATTRNLADAQARACMVQDTCEGTCMSHDKADGGGACGCGKLSPGMPTCSALRSHAAQLDASAAALRTSAVRAASAARSGSPSPLPPTREQGACVPARLSYQPPLV
eukprot:TRINITY_DN42303_c0_g1_i1.p1 TRINITY_DN42303_c0_g1~~TRINITY_DN42303_c0_g1_i1.p1  ORF type:complete len:507 (-),score=50.44 TRINITY_DN42303_c0_g1_i1:90-1454(-)